MEELFQVKLESGEVLTVTSDKFCSVGKLLASIATILYKRNQILVTPDQLLLYRSLDSPPLSRESQILSFWSSQEPPLLAVRVEAQGGGFSLDREAQQPALAATAATAATTATSSDSVEDGAVPDPKAIPAAGGTASFSPLPSSYHHHPLLPATDRAAEDKASVDKAVRILLDVTAEAAGNRKVPDGKDGWAIKSFVGALYKSRTQAVPLGMAIGEATSRGLLVTRGTSDRLELRVQAAHGISVPSAAATDLSEVAAPPSSELSVFLRILREEERRDPSGQSWALLTNVARRFKTATGRSVGRMVAEALDDLWLEQRLDQNRAYIRRFGFSSSSPDILGGTSAKTKRAPAATASAATASAATASAATASAATASASTAATAPAPAAAPAGPSRKAESRKGKEEAPRPAAASKPAVVAPAVQGDETKLMELAVSLVAAKKGWAAQSAVGSPFKAATGQKITPFLALAAQKGILVSQGKDEFLKYRIAGASEGEGDEARADAPKDKRRDQQKPSSSSAASAAAVATASASAAASAAAAASADETDKAVSSILETLALSHGASAGGSTSNAPTGALGGASGQPGNLHSVAAFDNLSSEVDYF